MRTSDCHCMHCDADLSDQVAAAVDRLNACIQQTLHSEPDARRIPQQTSTSAVRS